MRVLALETSGRIGSLAAISVIDGQASVAGRASLPKSERSAKSLLPATQTLLKACDWPIPDLDLICVTSGPGSFTGLRIGVTAAKTLAFATGAELVEVNTLAVIAAGIPRTYDCLWTVLDAQRNELFAASFHADWESKPQHLPSTSIMPVEEWIGQLKPGERVAGPPLAKLVNDMPDEVEVTNTELWCPQAELVGRLGIQRFLAGQPTDVMQLVPQYFRKSAAEEKADQTDRDQSTGV